MRRRVIAHGGLPDRSVHDGVDFVTNANGGFHEDLVRAYSLHGVVATLHLGDDGVVVVGVEPSAIANLPAGLGIEGRVVENDLAFLASVEGLRTSALGDDGQHLAALGASLVVTFEIRFRKLLICGVGRLLGRAFPRGAGALALFVHGAVEAGLV